eukprot:TRINITY_DN3866_c0_g1_i4.p1 TRINITY_DN3866_c0_g1~~TRINITY_DN3866_c0_g1_i4.p1  ORF type:complete len:752 (+),score=142.90 TRINITY_DN3866_c0_g1_i4:61-2316(+)
MGANESVIKNQDKRTSRRENAPVFKESIGRFRSEYGHAESNYNSATANTMKRGISVHVRKRPIFSHEVGKGEFDVISVPPPDGSDGNAHVVVHDARMEADMIKMYMQHHAFRFDSVFHEKCSNDDVYQSTAKPLVESAARGQQNTIMMYGQTGSGKTYTMTALQELAFPDLFRSLSREAKVTASFVELAGDKCCDMLNSGQPTNMTSGADGSMYPYPCVEVEVATPDELFAIVQHANSLRATAATGVHDQSSRSHAICRIYVNQPGSKEGQLTLVDLAGSEHRIDSDEHNSERRKEGAMINSSLAALKDCIRAQAAGKTFISYRNNRLTQLLRGCFDSQNHKTMIIATISPSSKDTEHSLNTLRHASIMDGQGTGQAAGSSHLVGGTTTKEPLGSIDVSALGRAKFQERKALKAKGQSAQPQGPVLKQAPAHQSKQSNLVARTTLDKRGISRLPPALAGELLRARDPNELRDNPLQRLRILHGKDAAVKDTAPVIQFPQGKKKHPAAPKKRPTKPVKPRAEFDTSFDVPTTTTTTTNAYEAGEYVVEQQRPKPLLSPPTIKATQPVRDNEAVVPPPSIPNPHSNNQANQREEAYKLWNELRVNGRHCREWRKNDLRLINTHVLPNLSPEFRPSQGVPWGSPEAALDDLCNICYRMECRKVPNTPPKEPLNPYEQMNNSSDLNQSIEDDILASSAKQWKLDAARVRRERLQQERQSHFESKVKPTVTCSSNETLQQEIRTTNTWSSPVSSCP